MKALLCKKFGPPADLVLESIPEPQAGPGEVIVDVKAVGLNFADTLIIRGLYQGRPPMPFSPGADFAGVVSALGEGVVDYHIGDRVASVPAFGSAREKVAIATDELVRIPDNVDFDTAAASLTTFGTAYHALKVRGDLKPGETVAVLGASGGVGLAAISVAKLLGARVIACASSQDKLALCERQGADVLVNYSAQPLKGALKEATGGEGVDIVYDPVGGEYSEQALRACGKFSRYLVIGFANGSIPSVPLNLTLVKNCDILGIHWGDWKARYPAANAESDRQVMQWVAEGRLVMPIHHVLPLERMKEMLEAFDRREAVGKVIIHP
ncbi:MAG: NADPH:quinone oxidoreductase family protein [Flavobacteriaceae bacterium]